MYLVAHQEDCEMVVGNRRPAGIVHGLDAENRPVSQETYTLLPRRCTCQPLLIPLQRSDGSHAGSWVIPPVA